MTEHVCLMVHRIEAGTGLIDVDRVIVRERIVRCRDCEHAEPMPLSFSDRLICAYLDDMTVEPGGFCAWGSPREEGEAR